MSNDFSVHKIHLANSLSTQSRKVCKITLRAEITLQKTFIQNLVQKGVAKN